MVKFKLYDRVRLISTGQIGTVQGMSTAEQIKRIISDYMPKTADEKSALEQFVKRMHSDIVVIEWDNSELDLIEADLIQLIGDVLLVPASGPSNMDKFLEKTKENFESEWDELEKFNK